MQSKKITGNIKGRITGTLSGIKDKVIGKKKKKARPTPSGLAKSSVVVNPQGGNGAGDYAMLPLGSNGASKKARGSARNGQVLVPQNGQRLVIIKDAAKAEKVKQKGIKRARREALASQLIAEGGLTLRTGMNGMFSLVNNPAGTLITSALILESLQKHKVLSGAMVTLLETVIFTSEGFKALSPLLSGIGSLASGLGSTGLLAGAAGAGAAGAGAGYGFTLLSEPGAAGAAAGAAAEVGAGTVVALLGTGASLKNTEIQAEMYEQGVIDDKANALLNTVKFLPGGIP